MSVRTITGNLAADPEVVQAGSIQITKTPTRPRAPNCPICSSAPSLVKLKPSQR